MREKAAKDKVFSNDSCSSSSDSSDSVSRRSSSSSSSSVPYFCTLRTHSALRTRSLVAQRILLR